MVGQPFPGVHVCSRVCTLPRYQPASLPGVLGIDPTRLPESLTKPHIDIAALLSTAHLGYFLSSQESFVQNLPSAHL
jgi:hypothetical protein